MDKKVIADFNNSDDYQILLILAGEQMSNDNKKYLMENCQERIQQMDKETFLRTLQHVDSSFCLSCSEILASMLRDLKISDLEALVYENKHYHDVSDLANYLLTQPWFVSKKEYQAFILDIELEKLLKAKNVSQVQLTDIGAIIIELLNKADSNPEIFDMIMKNYLTLLNKYDQESIQQFKAAGYKAMNEYLLKYHELNSNLLIFDCEAMRFGSNTNVSHFEFYDGSSGPDKDAFAYAHAGKVRINTAAIKGVYAEYQNKNVATQLIFYVIGHEIDHVFCERFQPEEGENLYCELKVYNSGISSALHNIMTKEYYHQWHNCLAHEYQANIAGITSIYARYPYLPCITSEDKREVNTLLARVLRSSYCEVESPTQTGYFGPVEFTRDEFSQYQDNLPGYAYYCLYNKQITIPPQLEELESHLTELERFKLGYHNIYIGIIDLLNKGEITTENIFEDLETLYEKYQGKITNKFPLYLCKK